MKDMKKAQFTFLGTGASLGVPVIGCRCKVCTSESKFNKRWRPSGLISVDDQLFLIDAGPDFRTQALAFAIPHLDGVLLTHAHFDHIGGLDDLRPFYYMQKKPIPCLLSSNTLEEVNRRCFYLIEPSKKEETSAPVLDIHLLPSDFGTYIFQGVAFQYVSYFQAGMKVNGFKIGNLAYISDIRNFSPRVIEDLKGTEILILSALRNIPNDVHFSVEEAIAFSDSIQAKQTFLTHIAHDLDYEETNAQLPSHIRLSYDGLKINFSYS